MSTFKRLTPVVVALLLPILRLSLSLLSFLLLHLHLHLLLHLHNLLLVSLWLEEILPRVDDSCYVVSVVDARGAGWTRWVVLNVIK